MLLTLRDALLRGKRRPRRLGVGSPTSYRGDGYEFVELRGYVPGDDVRRIDWAATARAGDLQTRVVLEDVALTLAAVLDDSASMNVGRKRQLREAGEEALAAWFGAAQSGDRCLRVRSDGIAAPLGSRKETGAISDALRVARAALRRGSALLCISDWFDLAGSDANAMMELARWCDCTALIARDPWYDGLPLQGIVRLRGAEGGSIRVFVGARERNAYVRAVREREERLREQLERCGWRVGILYENDGAESLARTFGLHVAAAVR